VEENSVFYGPDIPSTLIRPAVFESGRTPFAGDTLPVHFMQGKLRRNPVSRAHSILIPCLFSFLCGILHGMPENECHFMQLATLRERIPLGARLSVLGDFSARGVDWKGIFPGNPVELFLVDDFTIHQLGWVVDALIAETRPQICIFAGGAVDVALQIPPGKVAENLDQIFGPLRKAGVGTFLMLPMSVHHAPSGQDLPLDAMRNELAEYGLATGMPVVEADPGRKAVLDPARITRERVRRILNQSVDNPRMVMLGDSLTEMGGDWNTRLGRSDVCNAGQGGYTTGQISWLLDTAVFNLPFKVAFLTAGINDLSMGLDETDVYKNLVHVCGGLQSRGIKVVLQSTILQHDNPETNAIIRSLNERLERFCRTDAATYLDLNACLAGPAGLKAAYTTDGTHLTEGGYAVWAVVLKQSGLMPEDVSFEDLILPEPARIERR